MPNWHHTIPTPRICESAPALELRKGGAIPGHTKENRVKHSTWKHGEGVYPASRGWR